MKRKISILTLLVFLGPTLALGSIPPADKSVDWKLPAPEGFGVKFFSKENIEKYFPMNLTPTTNSYALGSEIGSKMGQRIADEILNGDFFKKSSTARAVQNFQKMTDQKVSFGSAAPGATVHTFNFQVRAVERYAEMTYSGFFNSNVKYMPDNNTATIGITHPIDQDMSLSFSEITNITLMDFNPNVSLTYHF